MLRVCVRMQGTHAFVQVTQPVTLNLLCSPYCASYELRKQALHGDMRRCVGHALLCLQTHSTGACAASAVCVKRSVFNVVRPSLFITTVPCVLVARRYICCNGGCPCSGRMGESSSPECCLCLEVWCCFAQSVASTRFMIQVKWCGGL